MKSYIERYAYDAMQKNEFDKFLKGTDGYAVIDRDDSDAKTDYTLVLYSGVYELYKNGNKNVKNAFENALISLSKSGVDGVYTSSEYLSRQLGAENSKRAPFEIRKEVLQSFIDGFYSYKEELEKMSTYKETEEKMDFIEEQSKFKKD